MSDSADAGRVSRRDFLRAGTAAGVAALACSDLAAADPGEAVLTVDPAPTFELSPYLYMQFMEPLGTTDGSVEAAWDHLRGNWRPDVVEATRTLAPPMLRWGGLFSSYYRWREGVGPRDARKPMHNLVWGGVESNQVGTDEFRDFCRAVGADPLVCVNFAAEGHPGWIKNALGELRAGDAQEAADWVAYCNGPDRRDRPPIKYWQLGNETSYSDTRFPRPQAVAKTIEFARAMRAVDESIKLIAWGDSGWAPSMIEEAQGLIDFVAFHHLFDPGPPCGDGEYGKDHAATWDALMASVGRQERKIAEIRRQTGTFPLALTESHFTIQGRNRGDLNSTWAVGVAYARFLNLRQRHGDVLKIANLGDFCGTRWQVNVVMIPVPNGEAYLMPVGKVAALYRKHTGLHAAKVSGVPDGLDVVASRGGDTGDTVFVHVVNTDRLRGRACRLAVEGTPLRSAKVFEITADDPFAEIFSAQSDPMTLRVRDADPAEPLTFPPASVTAVELRT